MKVKKVKATKLSAGQLVFDLMPNKFMPSVLFEVMAIREKDDQLILKPIGDSANYAVIHGYVSFPLTNDWYLVK